RLTRRQPHLTSRLSPYTTLFRSIFVMPDKMAPEKILLLKAYGAEVVVTPTGVAPDSPESYNGVADRLSREIPGAWRPNQFTNMADRKSTRLNSSHQIISYAVFCL